MKWYATIALYADYQKRTATTTAPYAHLDVPSRVAFVTHLEASWPEYNRHYAHPFSWKLDAPRPSRVGSAYDAMSCSQIPLQSTSR